MNDLISNILRSSVSSVMNVILLFTLTKSKIGRKTTIAVAIFVFVINIASTLWFYRYGTLTGLSRFNLVLFVVVGLALKPLTKLNIMQWSFSFLTTVNIAMATIVLSFHLGRLFPYPIYAHTMIRLGLYIIVILVFQRYLISLYQSMANNWPIFSFLILCIFLNLAYFLFVTDDILNSLTTYKWPLLLLVTLTLSAYGTVFYSLKKFSEMHALENENLKIQKETGRLHEAAVQLERYANYDMLTGLPNRRFFFENLERFVTESERDSSKFILLYIDLDGFKFINDTYGHEVGDRVLITVGNRILKTLRKNDFVARLGGDEFAAIIHDADDMTVAIHLANKIHEKAQEAIHMGALECRVNASIGIAIYPDSSKDSETLIRNADSAMYEIKRNGKGGIGIFK
ncbi:GGDEF domain-containing protein [Sphaerochaeta sp. PS]|uniref:GGDEF domain-containing protein n=1 Tax=Sphaerochaeta sp. PS TaxID=3076336 RepID=UPI0028A4B218|nr:GGDEF domain-containing protein [Sphaerochaeta sp. PS]MDT4762299.1 GGDEF domain-containing protein [Sphaerochaeta sp. PS]